MNYRKFISFIMPLIFVFTTFTPQAFGKTNKVYDEMEKVHQMKIAAQVEKSLGEFEISTDKDKDIELLVVSQLETDIKDKLKKNGAKKIINLCEGFYKIVINSRDAYKLSYISQIVGVGVNHKINLPKTQKAPIALPQLEYSNQDTTIKDLWKAGYDGKGSLIAVIDTGFEPNNELLTMTSDGKLKIVDYQDFNSAGFMFDNPQPAEGDVKLSEMTVNSSEIVIPYSYSYKDSTTGNVVTKEGTKTVKVRDDLIDKKILSGVFSEYRLLMDDGTFFDTNNNGTTDIFPVVAYDVDNDGKYDRLMMDTDLDNSFIGEKAIGIYKEVAKGIKDKVVFELNNGEPVLEGDLPKVVDEYKDDIELLFNTIKNKITDSSNILSKTRFNFVCTRIDDETFGTWYANIAYDTNGHGTHVAGDAAANGYLSHEFVDKSIESTGKLFGPAKGAQVMGIKVFETAGGTYEDRYIKAMQYAAVNGADIVNMSLGSLPEITDGTSLGSLYADLLTVKYGTLFTISNGNSGPGLNSNGSPGDSNYALTVGAYCPSFYVVGSKYKNAEDQQWIFSSNGPSDDGRIKPEVVAPGSMVSAAPMWEVIGKGYSEDFTFKDMDVTGKAYIGYSREQGTSMAAPYAAGVAAALMEAVKKEELKYNPLLFKEAIKKSSTNTINSKKYNQLEIGYGMINPMAALTELRTMNNSSKTPDLTTGQQPSYNWPYDYNDKNLKYTSFNDLYVYPLVKYKNDERMRNAEAQGVYVRDKEIPESIEIDLYNYTSKDLVLNSTAVTYGLGQSTSWIVFPEKVELNKQQIKTITVTIDKTKLQTGVNTLRLEFDDLNTYQMDCVIPITIINYEKLNFSQPVSMATETIKPGAFTRNFISIDRNLESFKVSIEVPENMNGRIRPFIYFPNGRPYTPTKQYSFAGLQNDGSYIKKVEYIINRGDLEKASMDIRTPNPNSLWKWEGTWEIDMYCSYASQSSVTGTLKLSTNGVLMSEDMKNLSLNAGNEYTGELIASNTSGKDVKIKSNGLVELNKNKVKERITGFREFQTLERGFEIKANEKNIFHRVIITNASYGEGARVWLYLYKAKLNPDGTYTLIKPMINKYINVQRNGMESEMITYNLEPGYYVYALFGGMMEYGPVDFDLITQVVNESDAIKGTVKVKSTQILPEGETARIQYSLTAPANSGNYMARIYFEDNEGKVIKFFPIYASVDETKLGFKLYQKNIPLLENEFEVNLDADFSEVSSDVEKLYGIEYEIQYNPEELSAVNVQRGDVFTDINSYEVNLEIVKNEKGEEIGLIKYAIAFKGMDTNGISTGNVGKVIFKSLKTGASQLNINNITVGNYEGKELMVKVNKNSIVTATPDVNNDGVVDVKDFVYVSYSFGADTSNVRYRLSADVNKDGVINQTDLQYIIKYFNFSF
ncbi:hypothetical protein Q428_10915 [Fervidicella metallireducens AeB]|uniref:Dockerin domain-containing protein n=1 Tax=Fervidicella metallireducens AeB TaxID=1403537 RepID=A0A017RTV6_9CLOT|nr:S8 family serine peptidase [Fervidicella metallireducens]EYE87884.1 hypothetical protein Q428_10915 [Fervidicella metallireducens AeB]